MVDGRGTEGGGYTAQKRRRRQGTSAIARLDHPRLSPVQSTDRPIRDLIRGGRWSGDHLPMPHLYCSQDERQAGFRCVSAKTGNYTRRHTSRGCLTGYGIMDGVHSNKLHVEDQITKPDRPMTGTVKHDTEVSSCEPRVVFRSPQAYLSQSTRMRSLRTRIWTARLVLEATTQIAPD